ncbi:MAG: hypothetical protein HQL30_07155 [Candidatus Omnitrophica bacterium]|nr:hypothetical protein [Candidatus Omnitrophota bacterium]
MKKKNSKVISTIITTILFWNFSFQDTVGLNSDLLFSDTNKDTLAIWNAAERGIPDQFAEEYLKKGHKKIRDEFEKTNAPKYGGKGAWDILLEFLSKKYSKLKKLLHFRHPGSVRFTMEDIWEKYLEDNEDLVKDGNRYVDEIMSAELLQGTGDISEEDTETGIQGMSLLMLEYIKKKMTVSEELAELIRRKTKSLRGDIIVRSSGADEDGYEQNLAGVFISPRKKDERSVVEGVREILDQAIEMMWIKQNQSKNKIAGVPNKLDKKKGIAMIVQPFMHFEASGTTKTNYYGYNSIECVFGDADMAVRGSHANTCHFLYNKSTGRLKRYAPSFLSMPHSVRLNGKEISAEDNPEEMRAVIGKIRVGDKISPINEGQANKVFAVAEALENEIGVPLDIEWGFHGGKLYVIQIRPIVGDFKKEPVDKSDKLLEEILEKKKVEIASTHVALGATEKAPGTNKSSGYSGKVILFSGNISKDEMGKFDETCTLEDYIMVKHDVASYMADKKETKAKVLVDPEQGSRQAHNITLIEKRVASGEFCYCNSPALKNGLLKNIDYAPYRYFEGPLDKKGKVIPGVWISREDVTYFSDGLEGTFYARAEPEPISLEEGMAKRSAEIEAEFDEIGDGQSNYFFHVIRTLVERNGDVEKAPVMKVAEQVFSIMGLAKMPFLYSYIDPEKRTKEEKEDVRVLVKRALTEIHKANPTGSSETEVNDERNEKYVIDTLKELGSVLSFPLLPSSWEVEWMKKLRRVTGFIEDYGKKEGKKMDTGIYFNEKAPDRLRVLLVDDSLIDRQLVKRLIEKNFQNIAVTAVSDYEEGLTLMSKGMDDPAERFDAVLCDALTGKGNLEDMAGVEAFERIPLKAICSGLDPMSLVLLAEKFGHTAAGETRVVTKLETEPVSSGAVRVKNLPACGEGRLINIPKSKDEGPVLLFACLAQWLGQKIDHFVSIGEIQYKADFSGHKEGLPSVYVIGEEASGAKDLGIYVRRRTSDAYNVYYVRSEAEAIAYWKTVPPDTIVTDVIFKNRDASKEIMDLATRYNPEVRIIIADKEAALRSPRTGEKDAQRRAIEDEYISDLKRLKEIRENGWHALSAEAQYALRFPDGVAWGESLTPKVFFELVSFLSPDDPTVHSEKYLKMMREVLHFSSDAGEMGSKEKLRRLLMRIVFKAITNNMRKEVAGFAAVALSDDNILWDDPGNIVQEKKTKMEQGRLSLTGSMEEIILEEYSSARRTMINESARWITERSGLPAPGYPATDKEFDDITGIMTSALEKKKMSGRGINSVDIQGIKDVAMARHYLVKNDTRKAIIFLKKAILGEMLTEGTMIVNPLEMEKFTDREIAQTYRMMFSPGRAVNAVFYIKEEIKKMEKDGIEGLKEVVSALGVSLLQSIEFHPDRSKNIRAMIEKPLHYDAVLEAVEGNEQYEDRLASGRETFKMNETARIARGMKIPGDGEPLKVIKIWGGYAGGSTQRLLLSRFAGLLMSGRYSVEIVDDIAKLAQEAATTAESAEKDNVVHIMPFDELRQFMKKRLENHNARVIYADLKDSEAYSDEDLVQYGAMVFAGIAYLNHDDKALRGLYELLTAEDENIPISVEELRSDPRKYQIILDKAVIHNYRERVRLNQMMLKVLSFA